MADWVRILADQRDDLARLPFADYVQRERQTAIHLDSPLAQVVIGVRRCGKTTLCHQVLHEAGVRYAYVNFDDELLARVRPEDLNDILQAAYVVYGDFTHVFLDELQNVSGWELFVNRLLRKGLHVLVTGSNGNLLSQEFGTHLTGRYEEIELQPFSFREFLAYRKDEGEALTTRSRARREVAYRLFSREGGLPEVYVLPDPVGYLKTLYNAILFKDVVKRWSVRYPTVLTDVASVLLANFCREINYAEIAKTLNVKSVHTVQNYVDYLEKAYLIATLDKYSTKPVRRQQAQKAYATDLGFASFFTGSDSSADELGWRLENLVFLELRAGRAAGRYELYYWKNGHEVDFVLVRGKRVVRLVQASYSISGDRTRAREVGALLAAARHLGCTDLEIVTFSESCEIVEDGQTIRVSAITDWLMRPGRFNGMAGLQDEQDER